MFTRSAALVGSIFLRMHRSHFFIIFSTYESIPGQYTRRFIRLRVRSRPWCPRFSWYALNMSSLNLTGITICLLSCPCCKEHLNIIPSSIFILSHSLMYHLSKCRASASLFYGLWPLVIKLSRRQMSLSSRWAFIQSCLERAVDRRKS